MKLKCSGCRRKASGRTKKALTQDGVKIRRNYPFGKKSRPRTTYTCLDCNSLMNIMKQREED